MPEAMKMIRAELGNEAVILNSKIVHKAGFLGLFRKKNIEVIAAIDPITTTPKPVLKEKPKKPNTEIQLEAPITQVASNISTTDVMDELRELKELMARISLKDGQVVEQYPVQIKKIDSLLVEQELELAVRQEITSSLLKQWYSHQEQLTNKQLIQYLRQQLINKLTTLSFGGITYKKKYVSVVGPTGVGKTTTLAKLAAEAILRDGKKVAFITTDTYRIAAIDQLKTYAKILGVPIEVSYNIDDFRKAKERFSDYDVVFIDTAGRNFRNRQYVEDLKKIIDFDKNLETFLVLSSTSKQSDMTEIYKQFALIEIEKCIFTKIDETAHYGQMVNFILQHKLGVAYITNGQNVPDDIKPATPATIVNTLVGVD